MATTSMKAAGPMPLISPDSHVRHRRSNEVADQAHARGNAQWRPPDSGDEANRPGKLASRQEREVFHRNAHDSWITFTIFGSWRSFPTPENNTIAAKTPVTTK